MSAPLFYFNTAADVWGVLFCILAVIILITAAQVEKKIRGYLLGVFVCLLTDLLVNMLGLLLRGETSGIKMTVLHVSNYMEFFCGYVLAALLVQLLVYGCMCCCCHVRWRRCMRYTHHRGLTRVSAWVRLKYTAMNLKKLAQWSWKSSIFALIFVCCHPNYRKTPAFAF